MMSRMGAWLDDWRVLIAVYIACSGVWGILAKIASARLGARTASFVALTTAAIVVAIATLGRLRWSSGGGLVAATGAALGVASSGRTSERDRAAQLALSRGDGHPLIRAPGGDDGPSTDRRRRLRSPGHSPPVGLERHVRDRGLRWASAVGRGTDPALPRAHAPAGP